MENQASLFAAFLPLRLRVHDFVMERFLRTSTHGDASHGMTGKCDYFSLRDV